MAQSFCTADLRQPIMPSNGSRKVTGASRRKLSAAVDCALFEALEGRQLLSSVTLSGGVLSLNADSLTTKMDVEYLSSGKTITATINGKGQTYSLASVSAIHINGSNNPEYIEVTNSINTPASIHGGGGNDTILAGGGNDHVWGEDGNDNISGRNGNDYLYGADGSDTLDGGNGNDIADGGAGKNVISTSETIVAPPVVNPPPITSTSGGKTTGSTGSTGSTSSSSSSGSGSTSKTPTGSTGSSTTTTSSGSTTASIKVTNGVLTVNGDANSTKITVGYDSSAGKVTAQINSGTIAKYTKSTIKSITINGGAKGENISVTTALSIPALIRGNGGNDTIHGGSGNDSITGDAGNDALYGNNGNDGFLGGDGNDSIDGGSGNDQADPGAGTNKLTSIEVTGKYNGTIPTSSGGTTTPTPTPKPTPTPTPKPTPTPTPKPTPTPPPPTSGGSTGKSTGSAQPNAVITALESTINAEDGYHVHALNSQLNAGTPLTARYVWNFGDPGSDYNTLIGFNAGHVYSDPGDYKVTLTLTNSQGNTDTATTTVHVLAAGRKVYYVSNDGNDSNSGTSSSSPLRTLDKVNQIIGGSGGSNGNLEFRFNGGDTFSETTGIEVGGDNVVFDSYGSGAAPVWNWTGKKDYIAMIWTRGTSDRVSVQNLTFKTIFGGTDKTSMPDAIRASGDNLVVRNNQFIDIGYAINSNGNPDGVIVQKNVVPNNTALRSYFDWVAGNDHVILGNVVPNSTREAILRVVTGNRILIGYNSFTNQDNGGLDTNKNVLTIHKGSYAYVVGNDLHKGPLHIGPLGEGDGLGDKAGRWNYAVVEGNLLDTESFTLHGAQHVMYRNNISTTNGYPAYNIEGFNSTYNRGVVDATYVNNTDINNSAAGNMFVLGGSADGVTIRNNLYVAPNLTPGNTQAAPVYVADNDLGSFNSITNNVWAIGHILDYAQGGINYIWPSWSDARGYQTPDEWNNHAQVGTDIFSGTAISGYTPSSSSAAANAGSAVDGVFVDFYGKARPSSGPWAAGAVEV